MPQQFHSAIWRDVAALEADLEEMERRAGHLRRKMIYLALNAAPLIVLTVFSGGWINFISSIGLSAFFIWQCRTHQHFFETVRITQDAIAAASALDPDRPPQPTSQRW